MTTVTKIFFLIFLFSTIFSIIDSSFVLLTVAEIIIFVTFFFRQSRKLNITNDVNVYPFVSIIIPMRNEEKNVIECMKSIISLNYPNFEVIVGDDASTDNTNKFLKEVTNKNQNKVQVRLFTIPPIESSWTGKAWATSQLINKAKGELILVTDADVRHSSESLKNSVSHFLKSKADIMSRFPYPTIKGVGEWPTLFLFFALKFSSWFSLGFFKKRQAVAKEEYLMFTKKCYKELDGYESFKDDYPMILALFKTAFKKDKNVIILDDDNIEIKASAYEGLLGTTSGIMERINFRNIGSYSFFGIFIVISFATNGISKMLSGIFLKNTELFFIGVLSYLIFVIIFGIYLFMSRHPIYISILGPILGLHLLIISLFAVIRMAFNKPLHWKGRIVQVQ